jgi:hypothetical protein
MVLPIMLFVLGATCKAIADTLRFHFSTSIFRGLNPGFFDPEISGNKKLVPFTKYRFDAWHLANSAMIVAIICFGVYVKPLFNYKAIDVVFYGLLWNGTFGLFFDYILKLETWQTLKQRLNL